MKRIIVAAVAAVVLCAALAASVLVAKKCKANLCANKMRQWHAASASYCLEYGSGPEHLFELEVLKDYVKDGMAAAVCPDGGQPYAPFCVACGPVCPNGHDMAQGVPRPFKARPPSKLVHIYEAAGCWTNMILKEAEQDE